MYFYFLYYFTGTVLLDGINMNIKKIVDILSRCNFVEKKRKKEKDRHNNQIEFV